MSFLLPWKYTEEKATLKRTATFLRGYMKDHLKDRFEAISRDQEKDKTNDILSYIVKGNVFSDELTIEDLLDDFFVFLIAGMETTAITMTCFIWEILKKPTITQDLKNEIKSVLNGKDELDFDDLNGLVYMEQWPRVCIGKHFAIMEMKVLLTKLLHNLQIADARPEEKHLEKETDLTVKPKNGVFITVA
ncbi:uncharacterized protein LOC134826760 [Bolinopsis microptera]|uniref:uncharacterized protein LOC134826760 n=1 Tax=Bolinopsis microptera TaxID=2820187 RepID=UPI00307AB226